jgi:anti-anti-sigma factor
VTVKLLPKAMNLRQGRTFARELSGLMDTDHPRLVLDCSNLQQMNTPAIYLLLCCLEEAMKRNGDVRLSGVSEEARVVLESTGTDGLFSIFDSNQEAENSFRRRLNVVALRDDLQTASQ